MASTSQKGVCMVYVPVPKKRIGKNIALTVIREKLAGCANIIGPSLSLFEWKGKVSTVREYVLILKTTEKAYVPLEKRLKELHPYDSPCIAKITLARLNTEFQNWLVKSVR
jgi:periplasmic divalent cation tolerance protein